MWYNMQQLRLYLREAGLLDAFAYARFIITRTDFLYLCQPQLVASLAPMGWQRRSLLCGAALADIRLSGREWP